MQINLTARGRQEDFQTLDDRTPEHLNTEFDTIRSKLTDIVESLNAYAIDLTTDVTGILPEVHGGTGATSAPITAWAAWDRRVAGFTAHGSTITSGLYDWGLDGLSVTGFNNTTADNTSWWTELRTTAAIGNTASLTWNNWCRINHLPRYRIYMHTGASLDALRLWCGWTNATPAGLDDMSANHCAMFRYSTVAGDGGWVGVSSNGIAQSVTSTVATIATSTTYILDITVNSLSSISFSVNEGTPQEITTTISSGTNLVPWLSVETRSAATKSFFVSRLYLEAN
jgi:hypothetical protein